MGKSDLLHIRVGKEMKDQMKSLIDLGMFSTESEIAREAIRTLLIRYIKEAGYERQLNEKKNDKKKK